MACMYLCFGSVFWLLVMKPGLLRHAGTWMYLSMVTHAGAKKLRSLVCLCFGSLWWFSTVRSRAPFVCHALWRLLRTGYRCHVRSKVQASGLHMALDCSVITDGYTSLVYMCSVSMSVLAADHLTVVCVTGTGFCFCISCSPALLSPAVAV